LTIYDFPPMTWSDFLAIPDGETVHNYGAQECVALANLYATSVLGCNLRTVNIGSAEEWWTTDAILDAWGFDRVTENPQVGDIFIGSFGLYDSQFGHIGVVVRAWDGSTFGTMEQNVGREVVSRHDRTMRNIDGFLRTRNQAAIGGGAPTPAPAANLAPTQRQAGPLGVFRRAEPNQSSEHLDGDLEAGEVGNFVGYVHGEDRGGNDIWFQGVSGNYFWSGAFTDSGTHDLPDLNAPAAPAPAPEPAPVADPAPAAPVADPAPVEPALVNVDPTPLPSVTPTSTTSDVVAPVKEAPVPLTAEEIAKQTASIEALPEPDLGAIIPTAKGRKVAYALYAGVSLVVANTAVAFAALQTAFPAWLVVALAVVGNLATPFSAIAIANAKNASK